ncbi:hypothetical protein DC498_25325 [Terrimonas sp.]|nr:hypothetical protein DC498_25325 [Terrimonas sp.]
MRSPYSTIGLILIICAMLLTAANAQVIEPYKKIHGGKFQKTKHKNSPDPYVNYRWISTNADDSLQVYELFPGSVQASPATSFQIKGSSVIVQGEGEIFFDFGVVSAGWVEFESEDMNGEVLASISEYQEPAILNAGAQHPVKTLKPVKYGNAYRLELNNLLYEGVRFAWLHVNSFNSKWHLKNFKLVCQIKPSNYNGSFYSNDTMLNRIWYTGAYTVKLNLLQDYFGAILMERSDRHSWTGDAYPSQEASLSAFGNFDFVRKNILFTSVQDNGIAAYAIYWVLGLLDYYQYTGDSAFLKTLMNNAHKKLQVAYDHFDNLPKLVFMGWDERLGAGFEQPDISEPQQAYRWLCINAWRKFSAALRSINEDSLANKFAEYADTRQMQLLNDDMALKKMGIHALAEAMNAGLYQSADLLTLFNERCKDRNERLSYSSFNQYFIIQALALTGKYVDALSTINDHWGGQIKYGGTTFFEVFRPSWNDALLPNSAPVNNQCGYTSLAHPWGAGVVRWISEEILGVKNLSLGFRKFRAAPNITGGLTEVAGDVPTPYGNIKVAINVLKGNFVIDVPQGTVAGEVGIPKIGKQIQQIILNGKKILPAGEDNQFVYLKNLEPGKYNIKFKYSEKAYHFKTDSTDLKYKISTFKIAPAISNASVIPDETDGCLQPADDKSLTKFRKPGYVDSVVVRRAGQRRWNTKNAPEGSLPTQYAFITKDPIPTLQTFPLDVYSEKGVSYDIILHFIDPDSKGRRCAFEVFDLENFELLAPAQIVDNIQTGKLVRFRVDRPVRIRINQVRGPNAALAGIYFHQ